MLELVSLTGVASALQVQRWAFHDPASSPLSQARRSRRVLARLHCDGYLLRLERRLGGARAGSSGWLYQLATPGRHELGLPGRGRRWEPGARFVNHSLEITELHLRLIEAQRRGDISGLSVAHEPAIWRRFTSSIGIETLRPDLLVELTTADGWELRWFVEVDRGTEHLPTIAGKCQVYQRYWGSGAEHRHHEVFPRVLWAVPNQPRATAIVEAIRRSPSLTNDLFRVVTDTEAVAALRSSTQATKGGQP